MSTPYYVPPAPNHPYEPDCITLSHLTDPLSEKFPDTDCSSTVWIITYGSDKKGANIWKLCWQIHLYSCMETKYGTAELLKPSEEDDQYEMPLTYHGAKTHSLVENTISGLTREYVYASVGETSLQERKKLEEFAEEEAFSKGSGNGLSPQAFIVGVLYRALQAHILAPEDVMLILYSLFSRLLSGRVSEDTFDTVKAPTDDDTPCSITSDI
ncbi:uncharacterized protein STEHIDRAFT_115202 [Stereum hirsutum FP-91666 SS1]|uniref:uncharacterized protein n=1 Tax=Stereum hirsutum (strain FP-91666) TaxID=721885 RepID=UPI000444A7EF|nr:uncharacterized protein STEHIDRAFT_115202 [Stereum hirsutum FP-91666 SS1]EIM81012.1 hypothetical protein STEHIDRAFT_115202 [Stereum hirsutum FP-91666 SS1]